MNGTEFGPPSEIYEHLHYDNLCAKTFPDARRHPCYPCSLRVRRAYDPLSLLYTVKTFALFERMNEHRHTARLEVWCFTHFVEIVSELSRDFAQIEGAEIVLRLLASL